MKKNTSPPRKKKAAVRKGKITAIKAWSLAARHVLSQMFLQARVRDGSRVRLGLYDPTGKLASKRVWVVYPNPRENQTEIKSSEVIIVCQRTGKILYAGSAHDEG